MTVPSFLLSMSHIWQIGTFVGCILRGLNNSSSFLMLQSTMQKFYPQKNYGRKKYTEQVHFWGSLPISIHGQHFLVKFNCRWECFSFGKYELMENYFIQGTNKLISCFVPNLKIFLWPHALTYYFSSLYMSCFCNHR